MKKLTNAQHAQDRLRLAQFLADHKAAAKVERAFPAASRGLSASADPWQ